MIKEKLKKISDKIYSLPWVQKNTWLFGVIYRAALIILYLNFFIAINQRWEDVQVLLANPDGVNFLIKVFGAMGVFFVGFGLHVIRHYWREQYGYIELVSAAVFGYFVVGKFLTVEMSKTDEFGVSIFAMVACVYLVVRGMDNVIEGRDELPEKEHQKRLAELEREYLVKLIDIKIQHAWEGSS